VRNSSSRLGLTPHPKYLRIPACPADLFSCLRLDTGLAKFRVAFVSIVATVSVESGRLNDGSSQVAECDSVSRNSEI
jgi:hypothetical protein